VGTLFGSSAVQEHLLLFGQLKGGWHATFFFLGRTRYLAHIKKNGNFMIDEAGPRQSRGGRRATATTNQFSVKVQKYLAWAARIIHLPAGGVTLFLDL
jgi:hypothetical protein